MLDDDRCGGNRTHIAPLIVRAVRLLVLHPNRIEWLTQRADRLFGRPENQRLPVGHATLEPPGVVRRSHISQMGQMRKTRVVMDRVVHLRTSLARCLKSHPYLYSLDRLNGHDRLS